MFLTRFFFGGGGFQLKKKKFLSIKSFSCFLFQIYFSCRTFFFVGRGMFGPEKKERKIILKKKNENELPLVGGRLIISLLMGFQSENCRKKNNKKIRGLLILNHRPTRRLVIFFFFFFT